MKSNAFLLPRGKNRIKVWRYSPDVSGGLSPAVIICHGIPGGIPDPHDTGYLPLVERLVAEGYSCIIFNFSGCGESSGDIDMRAWYQDLYALQDQVAQTPGIDPQAIHAVGFSAGGAIAAKVAGQDGRFQGVLLMATPADLSQILPDDPVLLRDHFRALGVIRDPAFPPDLNAWYRGFADLKPAAYLPFVSPRPVGIVHGTQDTVVPLGHAHQLYQAACEPKRITILEGAPHQLRRDGRATGLILEWLADVV